MPTKFIHPYFADYKEGLGRAMTYWLYSDPFANPVFADESKWPTGPTVTWVSRKVTFGDAANPIAASGGTLTIALDQLFGGKNALVFSQMGSSAIEPVAATPVTTLPAATYITVLEEKSDLAFEIETQPMENAFGTIPGQPKMFALPRFWYGPDARRFTITNNTNDVRIITISFLAAVLDSGR